MKSTCESYRDICSGSEGGTIMGCPSSRDSPITAPISRCIVSSIIIDHPILAAYEKEILEETAKSTTCNCDDYEVCGYENSDP
ncbi:MAG: hypothetical protein V1685_03625 [Parcubacteria group bacterium]